MFGALKKSIGIDIGAGSIKIVELAITRNGLAMREGRVIEYPAAMYKMGKDEKSKVIRNLLGEYLKQKNISGYKISIGLSGQSVFLRFMDIPKVGSKKTAKIIRYEAMQQIPFPLEDVIWDYDFLKTEDPKTLHIVLAAVKKEVADAALNILSGLGIIPDFVDVAPLSLYNAIRFFKFTDKSVVIDIEAESTNVLIIDKGLLWTRTILMGENDKDLLKEISQSLSYYKSQYKDAGAFGKIFVTGGAARLPGTREFLGMHFLMNIEKLEMFENNTKITMPKELSGVTDSLGVAFGLALGGVTDAVATKINLLPKERRVSKKFENRKPVLYYALYGAIIISLVSSMFILGRLGSYTRQISGLDRVAAGYEKCLNTAGSELAGVRMSEKKLSVMANITAERKQMLRALSGINKYMPEDMVIEELRTDGTEIAIKGSAKFDLSAGKFKDALEKSKRYKSIEVLAGSDKPANGKPFSMRIVLNKDNE